MLTHSYIECSRITSPIAETDSTSREGRLDYQLDTLHLQVVLDILGSLWGQLSLVVLFGCARATVLFYGWPWLLLDWLGLGCLGLGLALLGGWLDEQLGWECRGSCGWFLFWVFLAEYWSEGIEGQPCRDQQLKGPDRKSMHALNKVQVPIIIDIPSIIQSFLMENPINLHSNQREAGVQAPSELSKRSPKPKQAQSYIPFLFKNKPNKLIDPSGPAPGQYESRSAFEHKNDRDLLLQKYNILMQNTKKIKQSVVFKSSAKRFNYKEEVDSTPISYAYRMSEAEGMDGKARKFKHVVRKTMNSLRDHEVYPSIPDSSSKFGYSLGKLGKLNKINKTQNQLEKEREAMREYAKKLEKERSNHSDTSYMEAVKQKGQIIQKLKQKVTSTAASLSLTTSTVKPGSVKGQKKPKPVQNIKGNPMKIHKVLQEKSSVVNKLGPGCYDVNQGTFGKLLKPERFQFFSSSSERFPCPRDEELEKDSNYVKKLEIQSKINEARKTKSTNFRRGLKKPQRPSDKTQRSSKQDDQPGPGAYNPTQKLVKAKLGKVSPFDKSTRFDPLQKQNLPPAENPLHLCRQVSKSTLPEKSPFHNKHLLKYTEIMQRNKQLLKNKKVQMEESLKKYRTNQNSQYSICSWESRPFSRNQGLPSVLKESRREG